MCTGFRCVEWTTGIDNYVDHLDKRGQVFFLKCLVMHGLDKRFVYLWSSHPYCPTLVAVHLVFFNCAHNGNAMAGQRRNDILMTSEGPLQRGA